MSDEKTTTKAEQWEVIRVHGVAIGVGTVMRYDGGTIAEQYVSIPKDRCNERCARENERRLKVMAAAPDLLAAAKKAARHMGDDERDDLLAAIAKAEGRDA